MSETKFAITLSATSVDGAGIEFETKEERELFLNLINAGKTNSSIRLREYKNIESRDAKCAIKK